ncbi:MAG: aminoacyl-tRNA hydrolase [Candidatus Portnoybacteria bacterium CG09_land_8_20_14_0_10_44_13]|uniref:Aminoacyl-tRNA hydrolase n=4 Tax=Candidatus Portnoyibacteriota TaxID=1817913 RepID=A0A2H0KP54_9BACT|nr:MAG: aminoacyl-tRNA hydrolase [Candidatus Portnoybacteria bacterium CG11_big_fil_rev_8_21_14_0_20_44_10]PIS16489.1 MAG: aminoacyl-tRNA hydrolase [Candidatus Portnoybacteria bacterium CG09_land_8_20_14_0_10_44_13]PIZ71589.1 MAG: aminoacyl-tRNA hydrolase [Candidatus Portnoybacteria bacterium CG_4_10_14_0_2_um_filter_44_20]PJA63168.1 MAG: aminoacyl-tRNA hydrolase [Candidatus Portnoybacteria bacterium CG_4_9_14_3_um_filter_44_9]
METFEAPKINYERRDDMFPVVPEKELKMKYVSSSGPGGQNVNRRSTCAQLRWRVASSEAFDDTQKQLILQGLETRINQGGELCLEASEERSQEANRKAVIKRLNELVAGTLVVAKERKETQPTKSSKERRMDEKRHQGQKKTDRQKVEW